MLQDVHNPPSRVLTFVLSVLVSLFFAAIGEDLSGGAEGAFIFTFTGFLLGGVLVWWIYCLVTRNDRSEVDPD